MNGNTMRRIVFIIGLCIAFLFGCFRFVSRRQRQQYVNQKKRFHQINALTNFSRLNASRDRIMLQNNFSSIDPSITCVLYHFWLYPVLFIHVVFELKIQSILISFCLCSINNEEDHINVFIEWSMFITFGLNAWSSLFDWSYQQS